MSLEPLSEGVRRLERMALELAEARTSALLLRLQLTAREMRSFREELEFRYGYNPEQLRIPRHHPGGGQWTRDGGSGSVRVASNDERDPEDVGTNANLPTDPIWALLGRLPGEGTKPNPADFLNPMPGGGLPLPTRGSGSEPAGTIPRGTPPASSAGSLRGTAEKPTLSPEPGSAESSGGETAGADVLASPPVEGGAKLEEYGGPGGGHHVPAKSAFGGAEGYDPNAAPAIPNAELDRWGVSHSTVTVAQRALYRTFARSGATLTWDAVHSIETQALVRGGMPADVAATTVRNAISALKATGISGPTRIPWSK